MQVITYDYLLNPHILDGKLIAIYSPIVPLQISVNQKTYPYLVDCLIDSGADFNLMPAHIGNYLGLDIKSGKKVTHMGIANVGITAYEHQVQIAIQNYSFQTTIHFSYDHKIPLVGRYAFFAYFKKIIFNENELKLELIY